MQHLAAVRKQQLQFCMIWRLSTTWEGEGTKEGPAPVKSIFLVVNELIEWRREKHPLMPIFLIGCQAQESLARRFREEWTHKNGAPGPRGIKASDSWVQHFQALPAVADGTYSKFWGPVTLSMDHMFTHSVPAGVKKKNPLETMLPTATVSAILILNWDLSRLSVKRLASR